MSPPLVNDLCVLTANKNWEQGQSVAYLGHTSFFLQGWTNLQRVHGFHVEAEPTVTTICWKCLGKIPKYFQSSFRHFHRELGAVSSREVVLVINSHHDSQQRHNNNSSSSGDVRNAADFHLCGMWSFWVRTQPSSASGTVWHNEQRSCLNDSVSPGGLFP